VLTPWTERPLAELLEAHGLAGVSEEPFPNDGWSGASLTRLVRPLDGQPFILKRTSWATDWIARSTRDHALREGFVASMPMPLADPLVAPYHGAAADGTSVAILMPDLSAHLLDWERPASEPSMAVASVERVLQAVARLHAMPWPIADVPDATVVWPSAPLHERLLLLSPRSSGILAADGLAAGERFRSGWAAFERLALPTARDLVDGLDRDPTPLLDALAALPTTGIHGDLKLANVAFLDDGRVALIDWQMTALAPVAVELGWLLVSNSAALPERSEAVLERYRRAVEAVAGTPVGAVAPFDPSLAFPSVALQAVIGGEAEPRFRSLDRTLGDWDAQVDLTWIVGLLLRGWRKGLDAEAGAVLASGVSAADDLAWWCDRAVEAATRRL
jgi:hypothetical protein